MALEIKVRMRNLSLLTIGGGSKIAVADVPFNELGLTPSSIKGAMRTAINAFLPQGFTSCGEVNPEKIKRKHKDGPCDVCRLFGYPDSKEGSCFHIVVDDREFPKYLVTRVAIDDKAQKAKEGALFTQEVVEPGTEFSFTIYFNCDQRSLKLLLYSLLALRLWRLGRNAMVDLRVENGDSLCSQVQCDQEMKDLLHSLSSYLW